MASTDTTLPPKDIPFVSEQVARGEPASGREGDDGGSKRSARLRLLRPILWRLHFIGGLLVAPIVISLAISGILFAWHPQVDALRFGSIMTPSSGQASVPLADQVRAARAAHPDWPVASVVPGHQIAGAPDVNTAVLLDPPGGAPDEGFGPPDGVNVYVDQATGRATGEVKVSDNSSEVLRGLHSSWTLGPGAEPLTELACAWFLVTLLIGVYLWWPGLRRRGLAAFAFRRGVGGRRQSKDWHNFIGVALLVPMIFLVITGLTWTQFAGERYDGIKSNLSTPAPGAVDPAQPPSSRDGSSMGNIDKVSARAAQAQLENPVRITPPAERGSSWTAASDDSRFPVAQDQVAVNGATGAVTGRFDYSDENWLNKVSTAGIAFHQAQLFGVPLQVFMTLLAVGVIALVLFGYRMWWQRRSRAAFSAPPPLRDWVRNAPLTLLVIVVLLAWLLPMLGLALVVWLVLERGWTWAQIARGHPPAPLRVRGSEIPALRPGIEAYKAALIAALGLAMVVGPHIGDNDPDLATIPRMLAWAWSVPLGLVFLACGLIGLYAMFTKTGKPTHDDKAVAT